MVYTPDLTQAGPLKSVGYLSREHDFPRGQISETVFDGLVRLARQPLFQFAGHHDCDLGPCGSNPRPPDLYWKGLRVPHQGSSDIFVPDRTVVYIAPVLILHYIRAHQYLPPARFLESILNCPEPRSEEYRGAIKKIVPDWGWFLG